MNTYAARFPKTAIAPAALIVLGIATLQTTSTVSVQSAAAEPPPFNQGQCQKFLIENGELTQEEAHDICTELPLNQGRCIQFARENPDHPFVTEEFCKQVFSPPPDLNE